MGVVVLVAAAIFIFNSSSGPPVGVADAAGSKIFAIPPIEVHDSMSESRARVVSFTKSGQLYRTIWYASGYPALVTEWSTDGYGHVFHFDSTGNLLEICEAIYGIRHGLCLLLDSTWNIAGVEMYHSGEPAQRVDGQLYEDMLPPLPSGDHVKVVSHSISAPEDGDRVVLTEFFVSDRRVEARWYSPKFGIIMRSRFEEGVRGHSFFFDRSSSRLRLIAPSYLDMLDGLAISPGREPGSMERLLFVNGIDMGDRIHPDRP